MACPYSSPIETVLRSSCIARRQNGAWPWVAGLALFAAGPVGAQSPVLAAPDSGWPDLAELGKIEVTIASRRATPLDQTAAAVAVLTSGDIQRSGAVRLPEVLRYAPGVDAAQSSNSAWSVSIRGFAGEENNKLLVMIDGRSTYNPIFAGTDWTFQDAFLPDVDRIEVVRGPGASAWGANAVNGVINVITKSAQETLGGLLDVRAGTEGESVAARYGAAVTPHVSMRVYAQNQSVDSSKLPDGGDGEDSFRLTRGGFRWDWAEGPSTSFSVNGELFDGRYRSVQMLPSLESPTGSVQSTQPQWARGGFLRAQLEHRSAAGAVFTTKASWDRVEEDYVFWKGRFTVLDLESQASWQAGDRHQITAGVGFRLNQDVVATGTVFGFDPAGATTQLFSTFLQDEIALQPGRWSALVGTRLEHHDFNGWSFDPTARLQFTIDPHQSLWAGVSRAVRRPNRADKAGRFEAAAIPAGAANPLPLLVEVRGNPAIRNEELRCAEIGYRCQPSPVVSGDLSLFYGQYRDLILDYVPAPIEFVGGPGTPHLVQPYQFNNSRTGHSSGGEVVVRWQPQPALRLSASYSHVAVVVDAGGLAAIPDVPAKSPRDQAVLQLAWDPCAAWSCDADLRRVGARPAYPIPAYTELDLQVAWRPRPGVRLALVGRNLLHAQHAEIGTASVTSSEREVARILSAEVAWTF